MGLGTVVVASRNRGKVAELRRLLAPLPWRLLELDRAPDGAAVQWREDAGTYVGNATIKAQTVAAATGLPALADDSGIEIAALGGWPGVETATWMGEGASAAALLQGLLARMQALPADRRGAAFVCVLALALPDDTSAAAPVIVEGRLQGTVMAVPRGAGGFGYDPVFVPEGESRTLAEMPAPAKDGYSHRGRAAHSLITLVENSRAPGAGYDEPHRGVAQG
ncbi:MAG: non-canonical purine NTP pyrophosphatase [Candidatus Dormibacteria bacterium]